MGKRNSDKPTRVAHDVYDVIRVKNIRKATVKQNVAFWCRAHEDFVRDLKHQRFCISKGEYGPSVKFNTDFVATAFIAAGFTNLPFSPSEFLSFWE